MPKRLIQSIIILAVCLGTVVFLKLFIDRRVEIARHGGSLVSPN